jgi:flagellin-like hook-associated protein FlgL
MKGTGAARIVETTQPVQPKINNTAAREKKRKQLLEQKKKLLDAIGTESYNGVNLFEGTSPTTSAPSPGETQTQGPLSGVAPNDPGVDISSLIGSAHNWSKMVDK